MKHSLHTFFQKTGTDKKMLFKFALLLVVALLLGLFALFYGRDITAWLRHPEQVRDTLLGLGVWGVVNLLEGYGSDNPGAKSQGMKQLMAGGGIIVLGTTLIPLLSGLF